MLALRSFHAGSLLRTLIALTLCVFVSSCRSIERLFTVFPLSGVDAGTDRVSLWPVYYQNGSQLAILWPIFDTDPDGFALRPLVTVDGSEWEVLPPMAWGDTETGNWFVLPAYSVDESYGLFPLYGRGWIDHVGPVWWDSNSEGELTGGGLFPVVTLSDDFNNIGPAWWASGGAEGQASYGLFPLFMVSDFAYVGPVFWDNNPDGTLRTLVVIPLTAYTARPDGSGW